LKPSVEQYPKQDAEFAKLPARERLTRARQMLQRVDDMFVELYNENGGASVRRELQKVVVNLGPIPALARALMEESQKEMDFEALLPLSDKLTTTLALAITWTQEADDCWNMPCAVQEIDEARNSYLQAVEYMLEIEQL